ncbi:MAG: RidA family protein [Erysipelotrichaceae bacterium]|nr:RidA family protein [Erysipelotrichaceae bacterium]MDD4642816.1 RidA family protein [Erysipelotrichaceae bacterium]
MFTKAFTPTNGPKAIGPYSPAVKLGDFVYLSGQLPIDPLTNELVDNDIVKQTTQVLENIKSLLAEMGLEMRHILKTTVFLSDLANFQAMNEVYGSYFSDPYPARSAVQVAALPKQALIEIECLVIDTLAYEQAACSSGCCDGDCEGGCCEG